MDLLLMMAVFIVPLTFLCMRGDDFHNLLVQRAATALRQAGFDVYLEHPIRMPDGRLNFIDVLATRDGRQLSCEIETTPRYVAINAEKAVALDMPLWVVVPTRKLKNAVQRKVEQAVGHRQSVPIQFLLPDELPQALTNCFPHFPAANDSRKNWKNRKTKPKSPQQTKG